MPTTAVAAQKHVRSLAPYNANTFAEQNKALIGESRRLRGFEVVAFVSNTTLTLAPGFFVSVGLQLNPTEPNRIAGLIAETTANAVLDATGFLDTDDFYVFALANSPSEGTTVDFVIAAAPALPGQNAPILQYVAGEFILEDALGMDGLEDQVLQARADSGADQFLLSFEPASAPLEINLTPANLPDGTVFPATSNYAGTPNFSAPGTNYVWFDPGLGAIQNNAVGFPAGVTSLWEFVLDASSLVTSRIDRRPWFGGGSGTGDADAIEERLKEILQHSVMQNALISVIPANAVPDVRFTAPASDGTFLGPSEYSLADTEFLQSEFMSAALESPANIDQVTVAVLVDQLLAVGDITIEVSRDGGTTFETVADNFTNHVFGAVPVGNNLEIRITNVAGGPDPVVVRGYGMYYNNIGGPTGVLQARSGLVLDSSGLNIYNTNPAAYRVSAANFGFTWSAVTSTLTWGPAIAPTGDDLQIEITDPLTGTFIHTLTIASGGLGRAGVLAGYYVYFDADRSTVPLVLQVSAVPPVMVRDRFILGRRVPDPSGGNDVFVLWNNHILSEVNDVPTAVNLQVPPALLTGAMAQAFLAANGPTAANPVATIADVGGGSLLSVGSYIQAGNAVFPVVPVPIPAGAKTIMFFAMHESTAAAGANVGFSVANVLTAAMSTAYQVGVHTTAGPAISNAIIGAARILAGEAGGALAINNYSGAGGSMQFNNGGVTNNGSVIVAIFG